MAELAQQRRCAEDDVNACHPSVNSQLGIVERAAGVRQYLRLQAQAGEALAVQEALRAGGGRGQLDVLHAKVVQSMGNVNLLLGGKVGAHELLPLA